MTSETSEHSCPAGSDCVSTSVSEHSMSGHRTRFQKIKDFLWGYDFFISYHWASGGIYAVKLAERLRAKNYDVFLDRSDYATGDDWKAIGETALRNTQRLVLVATPEALAISRPVEREVTIFTERGRHVIPIVFGSIRQLTVEPQTLTLTLLPDSTLHVEDTEESHHSGPSEETIDRLILTHGVLRRRNLRALLTLMPAVAVLLFSFVAFISWVNALESAKAAQESAKTASQERDKARVEEVKAKKAENRAQQLTSVSSMEAGQLFNEKGNLGAAAVQYWRSMQASGSNDPRRTAAAQLCNAAIESMGEGFVHDDPVIAVAVSKNEKMLATGCNNGQIHLWSIREKRLLFPAWSVEAFASRVAFIDNDRFLVCQGMNIVRVFDTRTGVSIPSLQMERARGRLVGIGSKALVWQRQSKLVVQDVSENRPCLEIPIQPGYRWIGDEHSRVLIRDEKEMVHICDMSKWVVTGPHDWQLKRDDQIFAPSSEEEFVYLVIAEKKTLQKRRISDGSVVRQWQMGDQYSGIHSILGQGALAILLGPSDPGDTRLIHVLLGESAFERPIALRHSSSSVRGFWECDSQGLMLSLSLNDKNRLNLWSRSTGESLGLLYQHPDEITSFAKGNKWFVTGCADGLARLWYLPGREWPEVPVGWVLDSRVRSTAVFRQPSLGFPEVVRLVEINKGMQSESAFDVHGLKGLTMACSREAVVCLESPSEDKNVVHVVTENGKRVEWGYTGRSLHPCQIVQAGAADLLVTGDFDGYLRVWKDWKTEKACQTCKPLSLTKGHITSISFNRESRKLFVGTSSGVFVHDGLDISSANEFRRYDVVGWCYSGFITDDGTRVVCQSVESRPSFGVSRPISHLTMIDIASGKQIAKAFPAETVELIGGFSDGRSFVLYRDSGFEERDSETLDLMSKFPCRRALNTALVVDDKAVYEVAPGIEPHCVFRQKRPIEMKSEQFYEVLRTRAGVAVAEDGAMRRLAQSEWLKGVKVEAN